MEKVNMLNVTKDCKTKTELCDIQSEIDYWRGWLKACAEFRESRDMQRLETVGEVSLRRALAKAAKSKGKV